MCAGSTGSMDAIKCIQGFYGVHGIFTVNWVGIYAPVEEKEKGMEAAMDLGREVVQFASSRPQFPADFSPNHITFGTHTL